jgi:spoIIIJ-associated protein
MDKKNLKQINKVVEEFFKKMDIEASFEIKEGEENSLSLLVNTEEPRFLIGQQGKTLSDIQQLLGRIIRKQLEIPLYLDLDINQYKASKKNYLEQIARETANQVALDGFPKELSPMTAFERRIVHLYLQERSDIKTESKGEGEDRRVVVRPA